MKKSLLFAGWHFGLVLLAAAGDDMRVLQERFALAEARFDGSDAAGFSSLSPDMGRAERLVAEQRDDGTWAEVDYAGVGRSDWTPASGHLKRNTLALARTYAQTHDPRFAAAVRKALLWWAKSGLKSPNWWWNEIGAPQAFGVAAILIDQTVSEDDRRLFADYLECAQIKMTGQNRVWLSRNVMMRGLLRRDEALVSQAVREIANEIRVSDGPEGIAPDWSFRQHGPQMQFGNYGASFILTMSRLAKVLATTKWAFSRERLSILGNLEQEGFRWTVYNGMMDVSALGRQLRHDAQGMRARAVKNAMEEFAETGWEFPAEPPIGFRFFPKSAYAVYRDTYFMASVKMHTRDILETETWVNNENTLGGHLADGALFTYATGHEYENIWPLWKNWRLVPGITSYLDLPPYRHGGYHDQGGANEVSELEGGGTAEGATVAFSLRRDGLCARKRWEFHPGRIVCTGEGISATNPDSRVVTCVEHVRADSGLVAWPKYADGCQIVENGRITYRIYAPEEAIHVKVERRTGSYEGIYPPMAAKTVEDRVLEIYIDHGICPTNAGYRYEVIIRK